MSDFFKAVHTSGYPVAHYEKILKRTPSLVSGLVGLLEQINDLTIKEGDDGVFKLTISKIFSKGRSSEIEVRSGFELQTETDYILYRVKGYCHVKVPMTHPMIQVVLSKA